MIRHLLGDLRPRLDALGLERQLFGCDILDVCVGRSRLQLLLRFDRSRIIARHLPPVTAERGPESVLQSRSSASERVRDAARSGGTGADPFGRARDG